MGHLIRAIYFTLYIIYQILYSIHYELHVANYVLRKKPKSINRKLKISFYVFQVTNYMSHLFYVIYFDAKRETKQNK